MHETVQEIINAFNKLSPDNQATFLEFAKNIMSTEEYISKTDFTRQTSMATEE